MNKGPGAEEKFKEISAAYEVTSLHSDVWDCASFFMLLPKKMDVYCTNYQVSCDFIRANAFMVLEVLENSYNHLCH